jgi:hypothetical protein
VPQVRFDPDPLERLEVASVAESVHPTHRSVQDVVDLAAGDLSRAGLMVAGSSFAEGDESVYHVTKEGFERRAELLAYATEAG